MRISQEKLSTYLVKNLINWQKKTPQKTKQVASTLLNRLPTVLVNNKSIEAFLLQQTPVVTRCILRLCGHSKPAGNHKEKRTVDMERSEPVRMGLIKRAVCVLYMYGLCVKCNDGQPNDALLKSWNIN